MPALPAVPKVVKVAQLMVQGDGTPELSRFFIQYTGTAPTNAQLNTFAAAVNTAFNSNLAALLDTGSGSAGVQAEDLSSATGAIGADATTHSGTRGSAYIGASSCAIASYRMARRYRGGHPRGYWPFGIQTDLSDRNTWKGTFKNAADSAFAAYFAAIAAAGWAAAGTLSQVNVSYYSGFHVVTNPLTGRARNVPNLRGAPLIDAITSVYVQYQLGSQRRRDAR